MEQLRCGAGHLWWGMRVQCSQRVLPSPRQWNLLGKFQGQTDTLLAPEGIVQAEMAGAQFRDAGLRFDAVRCSDLKRASRTAMILTAACGAQVEGQQITPLVDERLRECSLGVFEGLHKEEIFGPRFAALFRRLSLLPHEARIRMPYFDGLESPMQISERALAAARAAADSVPRGGTVACVTHSVILESLCAAIFHKNFESVHTQTLAWMRCELNEGGEFVLCETSAVKFTTSRDALALDIGSSALSARLPSVIAPATTARNAMACTAGAAVSLAVGTAVAAQTLRGMPAFAALGASVVGLMGGVVAALGVGVACGAHVYDARVVRTVWRGSRSAALAALAAAVGHTATGRLPDSAHRLVLGAGVLAASQATLALASVGITEMLVGLGYRASLRAAPPFGLWFPRLSLVGTSELAGSG